MHKVTPVIDIKVRKLCKRPYRGHKRGCPNYNDPAHADRCPPNVAFFDYYFDMDYPVYVVINEFDIEAHAKRMKEQHPKWTDAQLFCVLYWQGTARKQLKKKIDDALKALPKGYDATWCPEGMGIDVDKTLEQINIKLEWPPRIIARQVALIGKIK